MLDRVARVELDGSCVYFTFGKVSVRCIKATYGDSIETATSTPMGYQGIRARTPGTYKIDQLKATFEFSVWRVVMLPKFPPVGASAIAMPVLISFGHPAVGFDSDLLEECRWVGTSQPVQNDNKAMEVETTWDTNQILWSSKRIKKNSPTGIVLPGFSQF